MTVTWTGSPPTNCDLCKTPITDTFIDGRTAFGPWATMCPACHRDQDVGLGTGKGQKFTLEAGTDEFIKVEG